MAGMFQLQGTSQQPGPPGPQSAQERATRSVFVGNIPYEATEEQLKEIFIQAGPVVSFRLVYDRETGKPKGYGFCEYQDQETAQSAMRNLNNYDFNGRPLRVGVAAGESNKDDMKAMQQASGGPAIENPYGEEVEPEKAPEAISKAVASLPPEQMFELMKQMKLCIQNNPNEARNMLLQNPQLAYALLQAQIVMKIVDPQVAMAMLHREPSQIPPLLPTGGGQGDQPMQTGPPLGVPGPGPGPGPRGPMPNQQPMGPPQMGQGGPPMEMRGGPPMEIRGGQPMEMRGGQPMEIRGGQPMEMRGGQPMEMRGGPPMEMRGGPPMEMRGGPPMEMRGGQPMEMRGGQPMEMRGGQPMEMRGGQPMEMRGGPPMEMQGPPVEMRGGPPQGNMPPQGMRMMDPRERQEPGPPMGGPGRPMGPGPSEMGPRGPPFQEPMRGPRPEIRDPRTVMGEARNMAPRGVAPQGLRLPGGGMLPSQIPTSIPTSMPSGTAISAQDQEKAALIMQVLQLTDQQIAMLPPEQRQSILILKDQIAKSAQP